MVLPIYTFNEVFQFGPAIAQHSLLEVTYYQIVSVKVKTLMVIAVSVD